MNLIVRSVVGRCVFVDVYVRFIGGRCFFVSSGFLFVEVCAGFGGRRYFFAEGLISGRLKGRRKCHSRHVGRVSIRRVNQVFELCLPNQI